MGLLLIWVWESFVSWAFSDWQVYLLLFLASQFSWTTARFLFASSRSFPHRFPRRIFYCWTHFKLGSFCMRSFGLLNIPSPQFRQKLLLKVLSFSFENCGFLSKSFCLVHMVRAMSGCWPQSDFHHRFL